jgi:ankyrin repeat protein
VQLHRELGNVESLTREQTQQAILSVVLFELTRSNESELVKKLIDKEFDLKAIRDADGNTLVHEAARHDAASMVELLISSGVPFDEPNTAGDTPLHIAIRNNGVNSAQKLLSENVDVKKIGRDKIAPLLMAVQMGSPFLVQSLVESGADPHQVFEKENTALHFAAKQLDLEMVRVLLGIGLDVQAENELGDSPLRIVERMRENR